MATYTSHDTKTDLVINRMTREVYDALSSSGDINPNELYLVDSDCFDMFNKRVINLSAPEVSSDAATKGYVDDITNEISGKSSWGKISGQLSDQVDLDSKLRELQSNSTKVKIRSWI